MYSYLNVFMYLTHYNYLLYENIENKLHRYKAFLIFKNDYLLGYFLGIVAKTLSTNIDLM